MAAPITELLLMFLLGIASWSHCAAANKVTVTGFNASPVDGNEVIESWGGEISNNVINTGFNVKKDCPGVVQLEIEVFKDGVVVNNIAKTSKDPIKDIDDLNFCGSIDGARSDDDSCPVIQGEQSASNCDMNPLFCDMEPGNYEAKLKVSVDGNVIANVEVQVTVEKE